MLLTEGRKLYRQGRFAEAANVWQTAAKQYQMQGDTLNQALCLAIFLWLNKNYSS